jgi:hypothetical protein
VEIPIEDTNNALPNEEKNVMLASYSITFIMDEHESTTESIHPTNTATIKTPDKSNDILANFIFPIR